MPKRYRPGEVIYVLERLGWRVVRQRGSHVRLDKNGQFPVSVPRSHSEVPPATLDSILTQANLTKEQFAAAAQRYL